MNTIIFFTCVIALCAQAVVGDNVFYSSYGVQSTIGFIASTNTFVGVAGPVSMDGNVLVLIPHEASSPVTPLFAPRIANVGGFNLPPDTTVVGIKVVDGNNPRIHFSLYSASTDKSYYGIYQGGRVTAVTQLISSSGVSAPVRARHVDVNTTSNTTFIADSVGRVFQVPSSGIPRQLIEHIWLKPALQFSSSQEGAYGIVVIPNTPIIIVSNSNQGSYARINVTDGSITILATTNGFFPNQSTVAAALAGLSVNPQEHPAGVVIGFPISGQTQTVSSPTNLAICSNVNNFGTRVFELTPTDSTYSLFTIALSGTDTFVNGSALVYVNGGTYVAHFTAYPNFGPGIQQITLPTYNEQPSFPSKK